MLFLPAAFEACSAAELKPISTAHGSSPLLVHPVPGGLLAPPLDLPSAPESIPPLLRRGYQLAHLYCQACHLFPEPSLLNQETWRSGALRKMAPLMGVGRINLEKKADGALLKEAGIFPDSPLLSETDWLAICDYYEQSAPRVALVQGTRPAIARETRQFRVKPFAYRSPRPAITMVKIDSAQHRLWIGNAQQSTLDLVSASGELIRRTPVDSPPVSITSRQEGHYVTLVGHVFPSDEKVGQVILVEETAGDTPWKVRKILDHLQRPVETTLVDLNGDGTQDLLVSCFGNYLGRLSWYERAAGNSYREHLLIGRPGAIATCVNDVDRDGRPDVLVLMAQAREGVFLLTNQGAGDFEESALLQFHPLQGSTHLEQADFNGDGFLDLLITNGDNGEYPSPFKNYHGIRVFLNDGKNHFRETWFYPLNGAFKAIAADFDGDGDLDIAAISFFPNLEQSPEESFVYLENKGAMTFEASSFPLATTGRWLTLDVGDLDGDGDLDIVLGSFTQGPQSIPIPPAVRENWATHETAVLVLENVLRR